MLTIDLTHIEGLFGQIEGFVGEQSLGIAGRVARSEIIRKTEAGVDYNSVPFKPYKPLYAKIRDKRGLRTDIVNLRVTGQMLDSIHLEGNELTVGYSEKLKAQGNEERWGREFLNVDESTLELIEKEIERELQMEIEGWK